MGKVLQVASFSYAEVKYSTGDIGYQVRESVKTAQLKVKANTENVSGVMLPTFEMVVDGQNCESLALIQTILESNQTANHVLFYPTLPIVFHSSQRPYWSGSGWSASTKMQRYISEICTDFD